MPWRIYTQVIIWWCSLLVLASHQMSAKGFFFFLMCVYVCTRVSLVAQMVKHLPAMQETWVHSLGWEDLLEKEMATHSSILAWRIPRMEEPGRLQSMGSQRVGHDWVTSLSFLMYAYTRTLTQCIWMYEFASVATGVCFSLLVKSTLWVLKHFKPLLFISVLDVAAVFY